MSSAGLLSWSLLSSAGQRVCVCVRVGGFNLLVVSSAVYTARAGLWQLKKKCLFLYISLMSRPKLEPQPKLCTVTSVCHVICGTCRSSVIPFIFRAVRSFNSPDEKNEVSSSSRCSGIDRRTACVGQRVAACVGQRVEGGGEGKRKS